MRNRQSASSSSHGCLPDTESLPNLFTSSSQIRFIYQDCPKKILARHEREKKKNLTTTIIRFHLLKEAATNYVCCALAKMQQLHYLTGLN